MQTALQKRVQKITDAIERSARSGRVVAFKRKELYQALFYLMTGDPKTNAELSHFCNSARLKTPLKWLRQKIGVEIKIPQALHCHFVRNMSLLNALKGWKVRRTDFELIQQIANAAELDLHDEQHLLRKAYSSMEINWLGEVEDELDEVQVILGRVAVQDLLLGVLETYKVPKSSKTPYSEVFGICLGMASRQKLEKKGKGSNTTWFVNVEKAVPQIRAKARTDSVLPNLKSLESLIEAANSLFPQLEIIGDYHSHPYRTVRKLKSVRGWEASPSDFIGLEELYRGLRKHPKRKHRLRVTFIIAIARGKTGPNRFSHMKSRKNIVRMNLAGCHIYISAYRILSNGMMSERGVILVPSIDAHHLQAV